MLYCLYLPAFLRSAPLDGKDPRVSARVRVDSDEPLAYNVDAQTKGELAMLRLLRTSVKMARKFGPVERWRLVETSPIGEGEVKDFLPMWFIPGQSQLSGTDLSHKGVSYKMIRVTRIISETYFCGQEARKALNPPPEGGEVVLVVRKDNVIF